MSTGLLLTIFNGATFKYNWTMIYLTTPLWEKFLFLSSNFSLSQCTRFCVQTWVFLWGRCPVELGRTMWICIFNFLSAPQLPLQKGFRLFIFPSVCDRTHSSSSLLLHDNISHFRLCQLESKKKKKKRWHLFIVLICILLTAGGSECSSLCLISFAHWLFEFLRLICRST